MSTAEKVSQRIKRMRKGIPFSTRQWSDLGSASAVQKALSRLAQSGEIERVSKGIYVRPKTLSAAPSITLSPSATVLAKHWAKIRGYKLVPQGEEAAYRLGFQTQAPMKTVYWSNGPSRHFKQGNEVVIIKHTSESRLKWPGLPEGELYRSMLVTEPSSVPNKAWSQIFKRLEVPQGEVQSIFARLHKATLPRGWETKLQEIEGAF